MVRLIDLIHTAREFQICEHRIICFTKCIHFYMFFFIKIRRERYFIEQVNIEYAFVISFLEIDIRHDLGEEQSGNENIRFGRCTWRTCRNSNNLIALYP